MNNSSVLIEASELREWIENPERHVVLLDVRLGDEGRAAYLKTHVPGAVHVDLATELAGEPRQFSGKRPLPDPRDLTRDARRWGIRDDTLIVLYDDNGNRQAARGWWTLRWAGARHVRLLDGGLSAWQGAGGKVTSEVPLPPRGNVTFTGGQLPTLDADAAASHSRDGILIDARGIDAYRGGDGGGHIPGAVNLPTTANLDPVTGRFLPPDVLKARFEAAGLRKGARIGVYCGGGVSASHEIAALTLAGYEAALFPGSWSAWSSDPARPVASGDNPG